MAGTTQINEDTNPVAIIASISGVGSYYSDAISLDQDTGRRFIAYVNAGAIGSSGTVDFEFRTSATSGGTYVTLTGSALVQDAAGSLLHQVEVSTEQVKAAVPTAKWLKGYLKTLVAATPCAVLIVARDFAHTPVTPAVAHMGQTIKTLA